MLSKSKIKLINSLKIGKFRKEHSLFFAEGSINVLDFIKNGMYPNQLFADEIWLGKNSKLLTGINCEPITEKEMSKITALKNPSEVLAIFDLPLTTIPDYDLSSEFVLVLDDIKDPGNMGTIIRTADWFGVKNIVCSSQSVDLFNPKVIQATMGSLARVKVSYCSLNNWLGNIGDEVPVFGALLEGEDVNIIKKPHNGILIIGSEAHGISVEVLKFVNNPITIPQSKSGGAESLNAAIAAAILLFAFRGGN